MIIDATFIAFIAFTLFLLLMVYLKAPTMVLSALDARSQEIGKELHEARRLREEAEALLAQYLAKRTAAEAEAKSIVAAAKEQAALVAEETRARMSAAMAARERQALDAIAQAEAKASAQVRDVAAEAAVEAAEKLIRERMSGAAQTDLVAAGIAEMKRKFG